MDPSAGNQKCGTSAATAARIALRLGAALAVLVVLLGPGACLPRKGSGSGPLDPAMPMVRSAAAGEPRIGMVAQLFFTRSGAADARMAIELSAAGRARPVTSLDRHDLLRVEKVHDGSQRETHDQAASCARGNRQSDDAIDGADRVLRLPDFYFRFVSNRLVRDLFADYEARRARVSKA